MKAIVEMRRILLEITDGLDVILTGCSIAGLAMNVFRSLFLLDGELPLVPEYYEHLIDKYFLL